MMSMGLGSNGLGPQAVPSDLRPLRRPQASSSAGSGSSDRSPDGSASASRSHALSLGGSPSWTSSMPTTHDPAREAAQQGLFYPFPEDPEQQHRALGRELVNGAGMEDYMRFQYALVQQQQQRAQEQARQQQHRLEQEYSYLLSDPHTLSGAPAPHPHRAGANGSGSGRGVSPVDLGVGMIKYESP